MPFKKVGKNKNVSPSGRVFTDDQVKALLRNRWVQEVQVK